MEALRDQRAGHGGHAGLRTRADSPVGGASSGRNFGGGSRSDRPGVRYTPFTEAAGLPDTAETTGLVDAVEAAGAVEAAAPAVSTEAAEASGSGGYGAGSAALLEAIAVVKAAASAAPDFLAQAGYAEAAEYAGQVEDLSRTVEYLQILGAGAVDRTRTRAITAAATARAGSGRSWVTGWDNGTGTLTETLTEPDAAWPHGPADPATVGDAGFAAPDVQAAAPAPVPASPADDGCKNTAEFLRARLRISVSEGHRRIQLAHAVLPRPGITGHTQPAERPELATALAAGNVASRAATIITLALDRVRHHATEDTTARMEHALTRTASENDTDFLTRIARRWTEAIDQDGTEPTEHELHHRQGAFIRPTRRGLNHLEIFATPDQYEHLLTVMNTATNPRIHPTTDAPEAGNAGEAGEAGRASEAGDSDADLDRRTRPQQLLDGLVGACKAALTTGALPAAGGLRPQVMVTIDYRDLLNRLEHATAQGPHYRSRPASPTTNPGSGTDSMQGAGGGFGPAPDPGNTPRTGLSLDLGSGSGSVGSGPDSGRIPGTGSFAFTGPVTASTVRRIACDADIIPVLLGSEGRILDVGRTTRIFPPHIRKAIAARDQGCAFPGCTIPAPWCEAHHITYWSHGGPTSTENGTLLCTHHHHLVHKEQWKIQIKNGIPWFIPPPHIDPRQKPQRNHHQT